LKQNLGLVRVSLGDTYPMLWDENLSRLDLGRYHLENSIYESRNFPADAFEVNLLRFQLANELDCDWIWMVDADVVLGEVDIKRATQIIQAHHSTRVGLIGGTYQSSLQSSFFEKCYNKLCNMWCQAHQVPLAGNVLIRKELLSGFDFKNVRFGEEEIALANHTRQLNFEIIICDQLPLTHRNQKNFFRFFQTAFQQGRVSKRHTNEINSVSRDYLKSLIKEIFTSPLQAIFVFLYLCFSRLSTLFYFLARPRRSIRSKRSS
jgi:hypothetical protein